MIGIVVVTHGGIAEELVNATRTIVGEDVPAIAAVSIAWADDVTAAREAIERGLREVGGGEALVLTDMFGGTPTNLSLPYLSSSVEIVTGVNLPMVLKCAALQKSGKPVVEIAHVAKDRGQRSIYVASDLLAEPEAESAAMAQRRDP